ncbi:MAG: malonic semialdehyde reductase [Actinomycetaceae bacterium]|nr:malonic semialdehyde reductase [Actinomycetaceae bacterium]
MDKSTDLSDVLQKIFVTARTQRSFNRKTVSMDRLHQAYDLIKWAPTAYNSSPLRIAVVTSSDKRETLASHMSPVNQQWVREAPVALILCADDEFTTGMKQMGSPEHLTTMLHGNGEIAASGALMQAAYLLIGLRAVGLDVGPMTGADFNAIDRDFFQDTSWRPFMVVVAGDEPTPQSERPRLNRLDTEDVFSVL